MSKQISANSLWLFFSRVVSQGFNLIFLAILARTMGVKNFGLYVLFSSVLIIGNIFTTYGTDALLIREIAKERKLTASFWTSIWLQLFLSGVWLLVTFSLSLFVKADFQIRISFLLINLCLLPLSFQSVFSSVLRSFERMDLYFVVSVISIFLQTLFAFYYIKSQNDFLLICIFVFICQLFAAILGYLICKKIIPSFILFKEPIVTQIIFLLRSNWQLALFFPLSSIFQRLHLFVFPILSGQDLLGFLSASTRLVDGAKLGHVSVSNSLMPSMARRESNSAMQKSFQVLLLWSVLVGVGISFLAEFVINFIYGAEYFVSVPALKVMGFVLIPYTFSIYYSLNLIMNKKENVVLKANLISLLLAIFMYSALILKFGLMGAAWGTLISESIFACILFFLFVKNDQF